MLIYKYINELMIYCAPNINKFIVNLWKQIAYLESTFMNYPGFQFSKHMHFSSYGISIAKCVLLVPLLAEVVETHIDTRKFCNLVQNTI